MWHKFILTICLAVLAGGVLPSCKDDVPVRPEPIPTVELSDSLVLLEFHRAMLGEKWEVQWDLKNPDTWKNIAWTTDEETGLRKVAGLEITASNCPPGSCLPESLGQLDRLESLVVHDEDQLTGRIPESLYDCPLVRLRIVGTSLYGELSPRIARLAPTLRELSIDLNREIAGEIPPELGQCTRLEQLSLVRNGFTGKLPFELSNLGIPFNVSYNYLTAIDWRYFTEYDGPLPWLYQNEFQGTVPEEVVRCERWELWKNVFYPFREGFGFENY